jgi:hypothetical protein
MSNASDKGPVCRCGERAVLWRLLGYGVCYQCANYCEGDHSDDDGEPAQGMYWHTSEPEARRAFERAQEVRER